MSRDKHVTPALAYIRKLYAQEDALLSRINTTIFEEDQAIHISPEEGKLLHLLARMIQAETIVEIGTLLGYSAVWLARALPPHGRLITLEKDAKRAARTRELIAGSDVETRIAILEGDALQTLSTLTGQVDMVFMDADKISYPAYLDWAEKQVRSGGLIIADNTLLSGAVYGDRPERISPAAQEAMKNFNKRLADSQKFCTLQLPSQDGLTIALKI